MSLFSGPKLVIFLDNLSLKIYHSDQEGEVALNFSPDSISSQEILDLTKFKLTLNKFLESNSQLLKNQQAVIALSDELIYQKVLPVVKDTDLSSSAKSFFDSIPFDPSKISKLTLPVSDKLYLFATNKELYETIIASLEPFKTEVVAAIPVTVLGAMGTGGKLTRDEIDLILGNNDILKTSNFLAPMDSTNLLPTLTDIEKPQINKTKITDSTEVEVEEDDESGKKKWLLVGGLLLIVVGIGVSLVASGIVKSPFNFGSQSIPQTTETPTPSLPTPTTVASESATISVTPTTPKDQLKVGILNGSGISGQAGKVRDELQSLGYSDFTTGNATSSAHTTTEISVSERVPTSLVDELVKTLENILAKVEVEKAKISQYDIQVVTGSDK